MVEPVFELRKLYSIIDEIHLEGGHAVSPPSKVVACAAVVTDFLSGRWEADLGALIDVYSARLGTTLSEEAANLLGEPIEAFGKGVLVGADCEIEHGSAIIHTLKFGDPVRERAGGAKSLLPSAEKRGASGASIDIPLKHIHEVTIRSHHQTFEVRVPDAPRANELVVIIAMASTGRPLARLGAFGKDYEAN
jgi:hypothetical protein